MRLDIFVKLECQSNTKILSVGIKYSMRYLLFDVNNYMPDPQTSDMLTYTVAYLCQRSFWHHATCLSKLSIPFLNDLLDGRFMYTFFDFHMFSFSGL